MAPKGPSVQSNLDVDFVIVFRYATTKKEDAVERFRKLIETLASAGLATEVRNGEDHSLLVFVKVASEQHLYGEIYRSRAKDWMNGVRTEAPPKETQAALEDEPLYEAERLRIIYQMITNPISEGGAGISPKEGDWENVESVFALHDHAYNQDWIKKWSRQYLLSAEDLDEIRNRLGEKIAFYFAYTQSYFTFLVFPAAFGAASWLLLGHFSPIYAIANALWCVVFTEYWKHQEVDLGFRWGVRGVSRIESRRKSFKFNKTITDPVTGEQIEYFPGSTRLVRQLWQIPFAISAATLLGGLIAVCFGIEIFVSEVYDGPLKSVLVFLPTGILTVFMPILQAFLNNVATRLNKYENYETDAAYEVALTQKVFVLNFVTSYLGIFLTAFVYVPFGSLIVPYLDVFSLTVKPFAEDEKQLTIPKTGFVIDPDRLRKQVIYFTVTAQIVNMGMELVVPYLKRRGFNKYKKYQSERAAKRGGSTVDVAANDPPEETAFLARVRDEATLDTYDVTTDLREMVLQYGYLSLFSVVWPLTAVSFLFNDWLELRADALKICVEMQRPTPHRADTIGPWLESLSFLTWLGSITTAALVYMFSNDGLGPDGNPATIKGWALLLCIFFSEHLFIITRWVVRTALSKVDSPGRQKERRERYVVRKQYLTDSLAGLGDQSSLNKPAKEKEAQYTREALEEDARQQNQTGMGPKDRFWARQHGWVETVQVGQKLIEQLAPSAGKGGKIESKKEL